MKDQPEIILIADGGSTKTSWCLVGHSKGKVVFETEGYHPFFVKSSYISESLSQSLPQVVKENAHRVFHIFFYSAGGGYSQKTDSILATGMHTIFPNANIVIETDLLAAARSLLGKGAGFAAILGTGTNTCIYDGEKIVRNIESLGFLLGDEGSGSYIGKKIIGDYIREVMPDTIRKDFYNTFNLSPVDLLNKVYEHSFPNRYCASFAKFAGERLESDSYFYNLVYDSFKDFFQHIVCKYTNYREYTFHCVGSIGYHFRTVLERVAKEYGVKMGKTEKNPIDGLINFHIK